jgi:hypothetical protein
MRLMKLSMSYIISPLHYICNRALSTGIFSAGLKYLQIHPIYKKGEEVEISNYRPISVLTSFSKIFEKVIFDRLYAHVSLNNILSMEQHGFRRKGPAETAIFVILYCSILLHCIVQ